MTGTNGIPTLDILKHQARRLRVALRADGHDISHSRSLELLARQNGFKDWNTLYATSKRHAPHCPVQCGQRVSGRYLGQPFEGDVTAVKTMAAGDRHRVTVHFEKPLDVVTFDSFSAYRQRVSCTIDGSGRTVEKTSDGRPHMELHI